MHIALFKGPSVSNLPEWKLWQFYQADMAEIQVKIKRCLVNLLFPHLHRMARLTSHFGRLHASPDVSGAMETLCLLANEYGEGYEEIPLLFDKDMVKESASVLGGVNEVINMDVMVLERVSKTVFDKKEIFWTIFCKSRQAKQRHNRAVGRVHRL